MSQRINKLYSPDEIKAAIKILTDNNFHNFHESEAIALIKVLHQSNFKIVSTEKR